MSLFFPVKVCLLITLSHPSALIGAHSTTTGKRDLASCLGGGDLDGSPYLQYTLQKH